MKYTLDIDINNPNAQHLLNYISSLDFAEVVSSQGQKRNKNLDTALDQAIESVKNGQVKTHDSVMAQTKEKFPFLFD